MSRRISNVLKNHSIETFNTFQPLSWVLSIFAINDNVVQGGKSNVYCVTKSIITFAIFATVNIASLYFKNSYLYKKISIAPSIQMTDTAQMVYDLLQYLVDLWYVYDCGKHISPKYFNQYEHIDTALRFESYGSIKRNLRRLVRGFSVVWFAASACDYVSWYLSYGWLPPTAYSAAYIFLYIKILTTLDFSSHVLHVRYRVRSIGRSVYHYYCETESLPGFTCCFTSGTAVYGITSDKFEKQEKAMLRSRTDEYKEINLLTRCYLQLTEQVSFINKMFGIRILLNSLSLLIDLIRFANIAVRILLGTQSMPDELRYLPVASSIMRLLTCVMVLVSLVNQCENVYAQQAAISSTLDHLLINKSPNEKLCTAATELQSVLRARPITFSLANFFTLDNSFLISIASVFVTYSIILVQSVN